uniref:Adhesion G protein-coupled receptor D2 n=1 Tax=Oncorhynchus tshawytscha TaxID=74940 RepID=A0A8C8JCR8_ONCTS
MPICGFVVIMTEGSLVHQTSDWVFQLVNVSLDLSQAESFCSGQFSSLTTLGQPEDEEGTLALQRRAGLHGPMWVRDPNRPMSRPLALAKQCEFSNYNTYVLMDSQEGYGRVNMMFPALPAVSVCVRVQWDPQWDQVSTMYSYAAPVFTNEFQLRGQVDRTGRILLALIVHGQHFPYKASFLNDGAWHHLCVTWRKADGHWAIYVDGERGAMGSRTNTPRDIHGEGILILGQDQDSFGGNFTEPFVGNITDLNVWDTSLEQRQFRALDGCSPLTQKAIFTWSIDNMTRHPVVKEVSANLYLGTILGSSVISTTVLIDGQPVSMAVRFQLQHRAQCTLLSLSRPEAGGWWSTRGCEVISKQYDSTVCFCNHTTNFALLMQVYEVQRSPENEKALQVMTFIGCGVSLCGLLFTFILFIALGVPKSDRTTVHKNLIVALGIAELLLMCSDWASANEGACLVVTALLHFFFMASFSWMLVEGLLLWSKVVSVNISEDRRMKMYYSIGWGLPVVIVGVTLTISLDKYKADNHCWLNVETDMIWAFVGPVLFILVVNAVVLCRVVIVTVSSARRRAKMLTPSSASKLHTFDLTWAVTRPVLILLPVLGLTWLCGVLVHLSMMVAYVFIALNAFQGLYIFLVYAVYNSEVCFLRTLFQRGFSLSECSCLSVACQPFDNAKHVSGSTEY